jgi:ElaB/YqjD/DUF883 family membrane-anchored ribosome-binding protein
MDSYGEAKGRVVNDMKLLLSDTEDLLRAVAIDSKEKVAVLRPRIESAISQSRMRLGEMERAVEEGARQAARQADAYVHENPWRTAGVAAGFGAALGAIVGVLLARR